MDPLTAFSLACGVIQVVDFSAKTLIKCREIYKEGSLSEYKELEDLTRNLLDVRAKLNLPSANQISEDFDRPDEQALLDLARRCSATADQLVERLHLLKIEGPHKKRQAILKTVKLLWEKGDIQEMQNRLDGYRSALDTQILINLRQRLDLASLQHSKEFQDLDRKIQTLINNLSQGPKRFEELNDLIQNENEKTRGYVSNKFQEHERRLADEEHRTQLLKSLWYAEILSREETIAEAHSETFQWIFDKSGKAVRPWDNFITWLENGEGTYWISGKAGSGKSTLMNFLCQDERTSDALTIWSGRKDILMPKFFFWSGGSMIQKSFEGLLRSLLWQILHEFPEIKHLLSDFGIQTEQNRSISRKHGLIGAWTKRRLQRSLLEVIDQLRGSCCLCFFIDGLDEFGEDEDDLIAFVQDIVPSTGVKVCTSSRPYKVFEDAFSPSAKLRLQDLTYKDIQRYVTDEFQGVPQLKSMTSKHEKEMNELKKKIVSRAEGVFLWVSLAVKDQIRGLRNEDSPEQLQERLACLPSEVEGVYFRMLLQIDKIYRQEAARFLQMAVHKPELSVFEHALASYQSLDNILLSADEISIQEVVSQCQSTRKRIMATCVGLLEVHEHRFSNTESETTSSYSIESDFEQGADPETNLSASGSQSDNMDDSDREQEIGQLNPEPDSSIQNLSSDIKTADVEALDHESNATVNFVHRTAIDFLRDPEQGGKFLQANLSADFDPQVMYVKVLLGGLRILGPIEYLYAYRGSIEDIAEEVAIAEDRTGMAQTELCELIDRTMSIIDHRHADWLPNTHWCTRWGRLQVRDQDRSSLSTTTRSRSSSRNSFYSVTSEPTTQESSNAAPTGSLSFLCFAASHGLAHYVQQTLERRGKGVGLETLDYMLYCSIFSTSYRFLLDHQLTKVLKVLPELLRRGANPNAQFFTRTIWRAFLENMAIYLGRTLEVRYSEDYPFHNSWEAFKVATIAFVEYGADVHKIWNFHFHRTMILSVGDIGSTRDLEIIESRCSFDIQLSGLSAIKLCLRYEPEFTLLQEMCIARGAFSYSRCTILEVSSECKSDHILEYRKQYELSDQESRDFLELFEQYVALRRTGVAQMAVEFSLQVLEFYDRLDEVRPHLSLSRNNPLYISPIYRESEWSTYTSGFQSGTMGLRIVRAYHYPKYSEPNS